MPKGVSKVIGNTLPKVGEVNYYEVASFYPGTGNITDNEIKWKLFVQESTGNWRELKGEQKTGKRVPFSIGQKWYGHKILIEAFLHSPEKKAPPGLEIMVIPGERKINKITFYDRDGKQLKETPKYGQTLKVQIQTVNMLGETLKVSLWERDTYSDTGHDPTENTNIWNHEKEYLVVNKNGIVEFDLVLEPRWALIADKGIWDLEGSQHEYYLLVKGYGAGTKYSVQRNVKNETDTSAKRPQPRPQRSEERQSTISVKGIGTDLPVADDGTSVSVVQKTEKNTTCFCKEQYQDLIWGGKVSCEFRKKVVKMSRTLGLPQQNLEGANWLMAVMALETGRSFDPTVGTFKSNQDDNRNGGYVGLIQFGKGASIDLGIKRSELIKMTAEQQLDYVEKHFLQRRFRGKLNTKTDLYLAVNYPKAAGHGTEKDFIVYDSTKAAYDDNPMFKREPDEYYIDKNGKKRYYEGKEGKSYVWEFEEAINDFYNEGKSVKTITFVCQNIQSATAKGIVTYHIYSDGRIEKHIPKIIKPENNKKYKYIYHDKEGSLHEMGVYDIIPTQMVNGKRGAIVNLINFDEVPKTYKKNAYQYTFNIDSPRKYVNEKTLASLFGAMLEVNYNDISCNGFSHSDGSSRPSVSHINGNNGDFKYLRKDKRLMFGDGTSLDISANPDALDDIRQNKWNDALYRFGWKSMLGWSYKRNGTIHYLNHLPKNTKNHHHHLHLQGYNPNYKEIKE